MMISDLVAIVVTSIVCGAFAIGIGRLAMTMYRTRPPRRRSRGRSVASAGIDWGQIVDDLPETPHLYNAAREPDVAHLRESAVTESEHSGCLEAPEARPDDDSSTCHDSSDDDGDWDLDD